MTKYTLFTLCFMLCSCAGISHPTCNGPSLVSDGVVGSLFVEFHERFQCSTTVEVSLVKYNGNILSFSDPHYDGTLNLSNLGTDARRNSSFVTVSSGKRFQYVMSFGNSLRVFFLKNKDIYEAQSDDGGLTWYDINNSLPALTHSQDETSDWYNLWNVAVAVDNTGMWHMLVECGISSSLVGLCETSSLDGLDFDQNKSTGIVIPHAGNPWLGFIPGKGFLAVVGSLGSAAGQFSSDFWYITAATKTMNGSWSVHRDKFRIGVTGQHIADPHLVDIPGGSALAVSVTQNMGYIGYSNLNSEGIFDQLEN